jgi:hypothetical protein
MQIQVKKRVGRHEKKTPSKPFRTSFHLKEPKKHPETTSISRSSKTVAIQ